MEKKYDLIVVGGGFAGTCAAIAAGRQGLSVLLVEKENCLGGAACGCLVNPFMPYSTKMEDGSQKLLSRGIFEELVNELDGLGGINRKNKVFDEELLKLLLNRKVRGAGVSLIYHACLAETEAEAGRVTAILVATTAGLIRLEADYFIDATGDANLAFQAGCAFRLGREPDSLCQPMTLCFRMGNVDKEKFRENRPKINPLYRELQAQGRIKNPRENVLIFDNMNEGVLHFNTTRVVRKNPTDPFEVTEAELLAREQVYEIQKFLKENIEGFENCRVLSTALQIGARESRMIEGLYTLSERDLKDCVAFEDAIAAGNYDIDIHNPEGSGTSHYYFPDGLWYTIPYRSLLPKGFDNLLVAGRCISVTHEAQASIRIMPIVACLGEAAGVAASVAQKDRVPAPQADIKEIQRILRENGAFLDGLFS